MPTRHLVEKVKVLITGLDLVQGQHQAVVNKGTELVVREGFCPPQHVRAECSVESSEVEDAWVGGTQVCDTWALLSPASGSRHHLGLVDWLVGWRGGGGSE